MAETEKKHTRGTASVKVKKKSQMETAYEELKQAIISNQMKPGELIGENYLTTVLSMSRTPIREAIRRLETEGLVEVKDGVGTFVRDISAEEIADAYEVRKVLEILAMQTAIDAFDEEEIQRLEAEFRLLRERMGQGENVTVDEFAAVDWKLHDAIIEKSKNRFVKTCMSTISVYVKRSQYMSVRAFQNTDQAMEEHLEILDAIRRRDLARATQILEVHIVY